MTPRIGIDARLRAYRAGGIAEHVSRLIDGLATVDAEATFVVLEHRRAPRAEAARTRAPDRGARWGFEHRALFTPPHHRLEGWVLPAELWPLRLDLLHSPDVVAPRAWFGASVVTVHDVAFLRHPEFLTADSRRYYAGTADAGRIASWARSRDRRPAEPAVGRVAATAGALRQPDGGVFRSVRRADAVVVVSEHTRRELLALTDVDPARIHVVPNAVHPRYRAGGDPAADAAAVSALGLARPFVLFVSTIEPRKNVATLLDAFRHLLDAGVDADLALAGADGWHSAEVYAAARTLGLGERVHFLGFVSDDALAALYRRAAVLAHPAHDEGFGFTPAEAMAAGTPVVVSDAGSLPEVVGDAGLRVAPADGAAWADALARVLADAGLADQLRAAGRARAAQYTCERQARGTLAAYEAALQAHAGRVSRRRP